MRWMECLDAVQKCTVYFRMKRAGPLGVDLSFWCVSGCQDDRIFGRRACGSKMGQTYPLHGESCLAEHGNARIRKRHGEVVSAWTDIQPD